MKNNDFLIIHQSDSNFPALLREIPNAPEKFYIKGELPTDDILKIAIVGTRKATNEGRQLAKQIAEELARRDTVIVSGLALGIDTAAHEGAIAAGGKTIAVLGNGLNLIYPKQNENLAKKILELGGAIISEYDLDTPSYPNQFLERNRIISGLCAAVIVIEAPERSGSLATANFAGEQGRDVFVAPGPFDHLNYRGSHKLIRDGARLITSAEDILEDIFSVIPAKAGIQNYSLDSHFHGNDNKINNITDPNQKIIFETIQVAQKSVSIDEILEKTKLNAQIANQALAMLTVEGIIKESVGGYKL